MAIKTERYIRKPLIVDAVQVTEDNFMEIALWAGGRIMNNDGTEPDGPLDTKTQHIHIRVHNAKTPRQQRAFVGDWILYTNRGYKVYTPKAFKHAFDKYDPEKGSGDSKAVPKGVELS